MMEPVDEDEYRVIYSVSPWVEYRKKTKQWEIDGTFSVAELKEIAEAQKEPASE